MIDRFLFDGDVRPEQTWQLARWLHERGVSELTLTLLGLEGQPTPFTDALSARLEPFRLPSAAREHASAWRANELIRETELWKLCPETIDLLAEALDDGLFTYPAGEWDTGCIEDPTFYREGRMALGIVSHEREGVLRLSDEEHREVAARGIPTRETPEWI